MINRRKFIEATAAIGLAGVGLSGAEAADKAKSAGAAAGAKGAAKYETALRGKLHYKGSRPYELYRIGTVWNGRKPNRYPPAIVMAENQNDVIAAVKLAKSRGWKVAVSSGGHSFTASFLRDDALLINLSGMNQLDIHADKMIATISPSTLGNVLGAGLGKAGFMTPTAHGVNVGMGGFVLCGGHGWNSRLWGPGCANLKALDVVTADGELVRCDANNNPDYFWAARGGGPGFFGAAVRYDMAIYPKPTAMRGAIHSFAADDIADVLTWIRDNMMEFPKLLETAIVGRMRDGKPVLDVIGTALGNEKEAVAALQVYEQIPSINKAISHRRNFEDSIPHMSESASESNPGGWTQVVDGMWTMAPSAQLVPAALEYFLSHPTPRSDVYWSCWGPVQQLEDMAYSVQANIYMSINCPYDDGQDDKYLAYVTNAFKKLEPLAVGSQMNDENMIGRPSAKYLSPAAEAKLDLLRSKHDPEGMFAGFLRA